ncbi:MAG: macrocin O-methyltransferase [Methylomarinum sp.]|nr:macrocin O-methyltransferase [Methylomarinum sp.]
MFLTQQIKKIARKLNFNKVQCQNEEIYSADVPTSFIEVYKKVKPYTMTSPERIFALCDAVKYIHEKKIEGDIVECGVWKGGSMMAVAEILLSSGDSSRNLYLFDTFEGMTPPTEKDVDIAGVSAETLLEQSDKMKEESVWCCASLDMVQSAVNSIGYPSEKIHFVKGMVEQTIPFSAPDKIALLRLDTDWYESTKHEMEHLFPRLVKGGVLIIDDYGHWQGARKGVDEYIEKNNIKILLNRIDYTGRIAVKVE